MRREWSRRRWAAAALLAVAGCALVAAIVTDLNPGHSAPAGALTGMASLLTIADELAR